jgi:outer membrane receptor protein involved in Fe transport
MTSMSNAIADVCRRSGLRKRALLVATSASAIVTATALAGFAPAQAAQAAAQTAAAPQAAAVEEIVVTGSLIVRNGFQAPTPVTVINVEDIQRDASVNFSDFADKLPTLANSYNSHIGGINTSDGQGGTNSLSLRGLGANRTLVLLDGVRVTANSTTGQTQNGGSVDINSFPDALIARMDVVTGGATATYGSGALAGVVNVILDKTFVGVKGSAEGGVTTYGDDRQWALSLAAGTFFAGDKGHVMISAEDHFTAGIPNSQQARDWIKNDAYQVTNPAYTATNGQPFYLMTYNAQSSKYAPGGLITSGPLKGITFGPGGVPRPFQFGSPNDGNAMGGGETGGSGILNNGYSTDSSLDIPLSRQNLFGRVDYDITDNFQAYLQYDWAYATTTPNGRYNFPSVTIQSGNPFIPASIQAQMDALKLTSFPLSRYATDLGEIGGNAQRHFNMFLGGVKGKFDAFDTSWSWDAFATRSIARTSDKGHNAYLTGNLTKAVDAVKAPNGSIVCRSSLTDPTNGCVPYDIIGTGGASPAAINYLEGLQPYLYMKVWLDQEAATLRGEPFSTWAGPVGVAVGIEHDKNASNGFVDPLAAAVAYSTANFNVTIGSYTTTEGFGEIEVPLAKDVAWAKSLDLNGAVRITDFSTSGTIYTWKVGGTYAPIDDIRFRATRSRDTRSPNLGEFFSQGGFTGTPLVNPFLGNITQQSVSYTTGNATLAPEVANTTGLGVVVQPSFLPGFSTSFDYFKIDIGPSITTAAAQLTVNDCYKGITAFCSNIVFDSANNITRVFARPVNAASALNEGFDIEASYKQQLADINSAWGGSVMLRLLASHVIAASSTSADGAYMPNSTAGTWTYSLSVTYDSDAVSLGWTGRGRTSTPTNAQWIVCASGCPTSVPPNYTVNFDTIPSRFYMDASFTYHLMSDAAKYDLFLSINNLANNHPDPIAFLGGAADIGNAIGRTFLAGVRFKM